MIPTRQDLAQFEKACHAASGGDWTAKPNPHGGGILAIPSGARQFFSSLEDARHVAASNPKACLILLEMLKEIDGIVDQAIAIQKSGEVKKEDFFAVLDGLVAYEKKRKPVMILDENYKGPRPEHAPRLVQ